MINLTYEELNDLVESRALSIDQYFDEMELSDKEKERRKKLAREFELDFLVILIWLYLQQQQHPLNVTDMEEAQSMLREDMTQTLDEEVDIDDYIESYVQDFVQDTMDVTQKHDGDPYYYSEDRATGMAEDSSNSIYNHIQYEEALADGKARKEWRAILDDRTRETHRRAHGQVRNIGEPFAVGTSYLMYPRDRSLGADDHEIYGCRCSAIYF